MSRTLICFSMATLLVVGGIVHGLLTDRWSRSAEALVDDSRARLESVPLQIGDWTGVPKKLEEFEQGENRDQIFTREYTNTRDKTKAIGMLMSAGFTQNQWRWHTPLACYPAIGYEQTSSVQRVGIPGQEPGADFFYADFSLSKGISPVRVRVLWGWSGDGSWKSPDNPKLAFGSLKRLYKLYVVRNLITADEPIENDPCVEFLQAALPTINQRFFDAR